MRSICLRLIPFLVFAATGCSLSQTWTAAEKENAEHFLRSTDLRRSATRIGNQGRPFEEVAEKDGGDMLRYMRLALEEARLVRDDVLEKALPGMSKLFRAKFQRGLELQIRNLEQGDARAEIEGSTLHDEWVDWINEHRREVKIPK